MVGYGIRPIKGAELNPSGKNEVRGQMKSIQRSAFRRPRAREFGGSRFGNLQSGALLGAFGFRGDPPRVRRAAFTRIGPTIGFAAGRRIDRRHSAFANCRGSPRGAATRLQRACAVAALALAYDGPATGRGAAGDQHLQRKKTCSRGTQHYARRNLLGASSGVHAAPGKRPFDWRVAGSLHNKRARSWPGRVVVSANLYSKSHLDSTRIMRNPGRNPQAVVVVSYRTKFHRPSRRDKRFLACETGGGRSDRHVDTAPLTTRTKFSLRLLHLGSAGPARVVGARSGCDVSWTHQSRSRPRRERLPIHELRICLTPQVAFGRNHFRARKNHVPGIVRRLDPIQCRPESSDSR